MKRFKNILCVIDRWHPPGTVLERAVSLAQNNQAGLTVACIVPHLIAGIGMPDGGPISAELQQAEVADARQQLESAVQPFRAEVDIEAKVFEGTAFLEIIRAVLRDGHDLVIKAPEDPAWLERLFGSDDMHLLRKCPCPVWMVKPSQAKPYRRILAAVDVHADFPEPELAIRHQLNVKILELSISLALSDFAELHVANAWQAPGEKTMRGAFMNRPDAEVIAYVERVRQQHAEGLDALLNDVVDAQGGDAVGFLEPKKHLIQGPARQEIPALSKSLEADLVVMGTVARTGVAGLFIGNTAEAILEQIECSVLAVKPKGFKTPVSLDE